MQNIDISKTVKAELESCEREMQEGFQMLASAVMRIRDGRLYLAAGYQTFEDYCEQRWGWSRQRGIQIATAGATIAELPDSVRPLVSTERAARALTAVPKPDRAAVVELVAEDGPVTAKAITETAQKVSPRSTPKPDPKPLIHLDKTGFQIPKSILEDWDRAEEFGSVLREISRIKVMLERGIHDDHILFAEVTNTTVAKLENAYGDLTQVIPYAVCSTCQGHGRDTCKLCKGRGFLSKFKYGLVDEKVRKVREASCKN